ncbi:hypothetical protein ACEPAI_871 [Sanghuangporus weigelae]
MSWLAACGLSVLHFFHLIWTILTALLYYPFLANPLPLHGPRAKLPKNLALVLAIDGERPTEEERNEIVKSVVCTARWCEAAGINGLSVYDRHNVVIKLSNKIKIALQNDVEHTPPESEYSSDASDSDCSPTPPTPNIVDSRPISSDNWCHPPSIITITLDSDLVRVQRATFHRNQVAYALPRKLYRKSSQMTLSLVSYEASKALLAAITRKLATSAKISDQARIKAMEGHGISVESIDRLVQESLHHLKSPDLMIVHSIKQRSLSCPPLELYGFPPWLMRLTEIYFDWRPSLYRAWKGRGNKQYFVPLSEENFRRALDSYNRAEMRLGK